jgi:hypothetical protein
MHSLKDKNVLVMGAAARSPGPSPWPSARTVRVVAGAIGRFLVRDPLRDRHRRGGR